MQVWLEVKFARMLAPHLDRFKVVRTSPRFTARFRCWYCGDSDTHSNKTRGYIYQKNGSDRLSYYCHNCGTSKSFARALAEISPSLSSEMRLENIRERSSLQSPAKSIPNPTGPKIDPFKQRKLAQKYLKPAEDHECLAPLKKISQLETDHSARKYIISRKIPSDKHYLFYYVPKFKAWFNEFVEPKTFDEAALRRDFPKLLMVLRGKDGHAFGFQARALSPSDTQRYYTHLMDEDKLKIFGLERIFEDRAIYVTEGAIDSVFLPNAIAMAGADVDVESLERILPAEQLVYVYDNEPRNREIVKKIEAKIKAGKKVVIFPPSVEQKDLNDMVVKGGYELEEISGIVERSTYQGVSAMVKLNEWKRVTDVTSQRNPGTKARRNTRTA